MGFRCFLSGPTKKISLQNGEKTEKRNYASFLDKNAQVQLHLGFIHVHFFQNFFFLFFFSPGHCLAFPFLFTWTLPAPASSSSSSSSSFFFFFLGRAVQSFYFFVFFFGLDVIFFMDMIFIF